jgi:flavin-dependent dehydrogenase
MAKILVVGAGLSGMVAAIHLSREGREVEVLEGHPGIGGMKGVHPSAHTTPIDVEHVSRTLSIDLYPCFKPIRDFRLGVLKRLYRCGSRTLHCVERSSRATSIDSYLYNECLRHGVTFSFNTMIQDPLSLPPDTIIATGLHPEMFDALEIPYHKVYSFWMAAERSTGMFQGLKTEFEQLLVGYMDNYTNDYFYVTAMNDLWYALLFSRKPLFKTHLTRCVETVRERLGVSLAGWKFLTGCVPTRSFRNPRLFLGDKILTGSLSGSMDPMFLFGIHGALLSGKIAATAVSNPERAEREFRSLNRYFVPTLIQRRIYEKNFLRNQIFNLMLSRIPRSTIQLSRIASVGVPGYRAFQPFVNSIRRETQEEVRP